MSGGRTPEKPFALLTAVAATAAMALWMANREPFPFGPLWGTLIVLIATTAWVAWLIPTPDGTATGWQETTLGKRADERLSPIAATGLSLGVLIAGVVIGGYDGLPITIVLALLCFVPPALSRPGLLVMVAICAIYLPLLGTTGLWDPWETHYGEVAREILARNDWISLWWAQDKWFWSKPVLLFWMEALSMGFLGVDFMPDANPASPEWALRLPTIAMTLAALAVIYVTTRRTFGPRAAALATLVTATMPQFFFISHQAITDLPLVAAITIAACCLIVSMQEDPKREATIFQVGRWRFSLQHVVLFSIVLMILPQAVYLISRNISWVDGYGLVAHPDRFLYGSAGNLDVPGNPGPRAQTPRVGGLGGQPFVQGVLWLAVLGGLAMVLRKERRVRPLLMYAFYFFCAIAFMAKGLPGLAIPGAAALFYLIKHTSGLFINFLKEQGLWGSEKLDYSFGTSERTNVEIKDENSTVSQNSFISNSWKNHQISIVANSSLLWDTEQGNAINYGNLIHEVLSKIKTENDITEVINEYLFKGVITIDNQQEIITIINKIVLHPLLKNYFNQNNVVYNERKILTSNKNIIIPDRLVFNGNKVTVIDYKTGKPDDKYIQQVTMYAQVLQDLNFKVDKKLLVYINKEITIEEV